MRRVHFPVTDSTNTQARRLAGDYPGECLLITADTQSAGRGRQGRVWESPLGGAWLSIVWPTRQSPQAYAAVSLVAAVAVRRTLLAVLEDMQVKIKWPNDVLIDDQKVAGILCEQWPGVGGKSGVLVIGIGVNVDFDLMLLPVDLRYPATTLSHVLGHAMPVNDVIDAIAESVTTSLEEFEATGLTAELIAEMGDSLAFVNTQRSWQLPSGEITGRVVGIDKAGRLLLKVAGQTQAYEVGEFAPRRA